MAINEEYWGVNDECLDSGASHIRLGVVAQRQKRKSYQDRWHLMDTTTSLALLVPDIHSLERILTKYHTYRPFPIATLLTPELLHLEQFYQGGSNG